MVIFSFPQVSYEKGSVIAKAYITFFKSNTLCLKHIVQQLNAPFALVIAMWVMSKQFIMLIAYGKAT